MKTTRLDRVRNDYAGKRALVTGGFGFKGTWLALMLRMLGADVAIVGVKRPTDFGARLNFADLLIDAHEGDVRSEAFADLVQAFDPDYVFHLAAQPIVLEGYKNPVETFSSNVMGTVRVLEAIRRIEKPVSVVNVTTDKVYRDVQKAEPYIEGDELGGLDPYSSSKSCSELVTLSYRESFFNDTNKEVVTCRAGNVLGGGDLSADRIIPDIVRARRNGTSVAIRNYNSVRPYEHVLDALYAYILLAAGQMKWTTLQSEYNIGPNDDCLLTTGEIAEYARRELGVSLDIQHNAHAPHETEVLRLNSDTFRSEFDWAPKFESPEEILDETFAWYIRTEAEDETAVTLDQVRSYLNA